MESSQPWPKLPLLTLQTAFDAQIQKGPQLIIPESATIAHR
jgi:hypothetical protein